MKIIIEGCDGTGKTTLVKLLAERYGLDVCHCTSKDPKDFEFYKQTARKENVIWDRHTIGELIYPKVFDRRPEITPEDARIILSYFRENGGKVLVLTAADDVISDRLNSRKESEDPRILNQVCEINARFKSFAKYFGVPVIDTSKMTIEEIFKLVEAPDNFSFIHK